MDAIKLSTGQAGYTHLEVEAALCAWECINEWSLGRPENHGWVERRKAVGPCEMRKQSITLGKWYLAVSKICTSKDEDIFGGYSYDWEVVPQILSHALDKNGVVALYEHELPDPKDVAPKVIRYFQKRHAEADTRCAARSRSECACQDCDWRGSEELLDPIEDIFLRVSPGEPMPAGQCPDCGALAHLASEPDTAATAVEEPTNTQTEKKPEKVYSLIILWDDNDIGEQGAFRWSGLAMDKGDAEIKARTMMFDVRAHEAELTNEERKDRLEEIVDILDYGGSLIECFEGANIWAAPMMLEALREFERTFGDALDDTDFSGGDAIEWLSRIWETMANAVASGECTTLCRA